MQLYDLYNYLGVIALFLYNLSRVNAKKEFLGGRSLQILKNIKSNNTAKRTIILFAILETLILSVFQYIPAVFLNMPFGRLLDTGANYFATVYFAPLFMLAGCFLLQIPWRKQLDILAPAYPLALMFAKIGCFYAGCCGGFPTTWGAFNPVTKSYEFPCQLLEAFAALLIFIYLHKKSKRDQNGTLLPTYVIIYSGIRFFTEFTRMEPNVLGCFKFYHLLCLAGVIIGLSEYFFINYLNGKSSSKPNV